LDAQFDKTDPNDIKV